MCDKMSLIAMMKTLAVAKVGKRERAPWLKVHSGW